MRFAKLRKNQEFREVYRKGKSKGNRYLVMYVEKGQSGPSMYGFSVSKKVGNSVVRHHITRLLREIVAKYDAQVTEENRVVIIARPAAKDASFRDLEEAVKKLYLAHGIWKEN